MIRSDRYWWSAWTSVDLASRVIRHDCFQNSLKINRRFPAPICSRWVVGTLYPGPDRCLNAALGRLLSSTWEYDQKTILVRVRPLLNDDRQMSGANTAVLFEGPRRRSANLWFGRGVYDAREEPRAASASGPSRCWISWSGCYSLIVLLTRCAPLGSSSIVPNTSAQQSEWNVKTERIAYNGPQA